VVGAVGVIAAALLDRKGYQVPGLLMAALTGLLVSPISWDHHWVWLVPALAMLAGLAMKARPIARVAYVAAIVLVAAVTAAWPWQFSGPKAYVPRRGLLGWFVKPPQVTQIMVVHGWNLLTWNLWVAVGAVIYLGLLAAAIRAWRARPRRRLAPVSAQSPVDALLARADAVLRGGPLAGSGQHRPNAQARSDGNFGFNGRAGSDGQLGDGEVGNGEVGTNASRPKAGAPRPAR